MRRQMKAARASSVEIKVGPLEGRVEVARDFKVAREDAGKVRFMPIELDSLGVIEVDLRDGESWRWRVCWSSEMGLERWGTKLRGEMFPDSSSRSVKGSERQALARRWISCA